MSHLLRARIAMVSIAAMSTVLLASCGGGGGSSSPSTPTPPAPPPTSVATPLKLETGQQAADFLKKGTFGPSEGQIESLTDTNASAWLTREFAKSPTLYLPSLRTRFEAGEDLNSRVHATAFWNAAISADDQLRQRMVFALSQITVVSDKDMGDKPLTTAHYMDVLSQNAFGNYRDLLQELTYAPGTARFLTYLRNRKGDEKTGRMPDENYARELLQLYTIGLIELNMDGTPKRGSDGKTVEIFDNEDIVGLAKVFTGLSHKGAGFWDEDPDGHYSRLIAFENKHSPLEKSFMGKIITAGTPTDDSITQALDHIFAHPNVAPFVSRQLIQRFTASHPTPDYVERVATAFETGRFRSADNVNYGTGERGDLKATLAAILLDEQFFDDTPPGDQDGKIREPVLKFINYARAFRMGAVDADNEWWLLYGVDKNTALSQAPFGSPSVFNFYRPGFIAPGTETGDANLTAPELQIVNEGAVVGYSNFMLDFVFNTTPTVNGQDTFQPNYTKEITMAETPGELADHLNELLLSGRMSTITRDRIIEALELLPIREGSENDDKLRRVHLAVYMAVTSPAFAIDL